MRSFAILMAGFMLIVGPARSASAQTQSLEVQITVLGHLGPVAGSRADHFLTFSGPVQVPGVGLAPGAYIFRFLTPSVMQVLDENRSMVYAMFSLTPTWRSKVTSDYALTLRRIRSDAPARIEKMFLPEASMGYELTYPRSGETVEAIERLAIR